MADLTGHVAIVSGALGDIGGAIARRLARDGADIALGDIHDASQAEAALSELRAQGRHARYDKVDVTDAQAVARWVETVERELGTATLVMPNAAVVTFGDACEIEPAAWSRDLNVNLTGAFHLAQAAANRMLAGGKRGRIVFIGSWAAHAPHIHIPAYCASKAGVRMLCKVMAAQLAEHGILVNEVAPGYVDAGLTGKVWQEHPEKREQGRAHVPTHELIAADEVAHQVAHLCDPENRHMTGTVILMDGGLSLTNASHGRKDER